MVRTAALAAVLALGGCAYTDANCTDLTRGECHLRSARVLTDTQLGVKALNGYSVDLSSNPDGQLALELARALGAAYAGRVPRPLVRPEVEDSDNDIGKMLFDGSDVPLLRPLPVSRSCSAVPYAVSRAAY